MRICPSVSAMLFSSLPQLFVPSGLADTYCNILQRTKGLEEKVILPVHAVYGKSTQSHFAVNAQLQPACIVQPHSADDVALAVNILTCPLQPCQFAVRSGGHTTWAGAAGIENGVTVDMSAMNGTVYNKDAGTASILPGSRWQQVYETLEPYGVTVAGGRGGTVGVGGFLIGGGNTLYTARVGFACDNVENFEIVLASGEIVNANKTAHPDLYKALKGGSINFGIVTRYDMKTLSHDNLWGGMVVYDNSTTPQQIDAAHDFINNVHKDPFASWIGMWHYSSAIGVNMIVSPIHYTKPQPYPAALGDFVKIPNVTDTMRIAGTWNMTQELIQAEGYRDIFVTATCVNKKEALQRAVTVHNEVLEEAKSQAKSQYWSVITMLQPWPKLFAQQSVKRGGNVLGLERFDKNHFQVLLDYSWDDEEDDVLFQRLASSALDQLITYARSIGADNEYIYLNYADRTQNPLRSYGRENVEYMRRVARQYDPTGVFQHQVPGGFKVSAA